MKKVIIEKSVNINNLNGLIDCGCLDENELNDFINIVKNNGSGIYEIMFGCRGIIEDIIKNDEYLSIEEVKEFYCDGIDYEYVEEFYDDSVNCYDLDYVFCVNYLEEDGSVFVNVSV